MVKIPKYFKPNENALEPLLDLNKEEERIKYIQQEKQKLKIENEKETNLKNILNLK